MNTNEIRNILKYFDIKTTGLCVRDGKVLEKLSYGSPLGAPYNFSILHDNTDAGMIDAIKAHITKARYDCNDPYDTNIVLQISDAISSVRSAMTDEARHAAEKHHA